jgi:hypothetical protein
MAASCKDTAMPSSENIPHILAVKHLPQNQDTIIFPSIDNLFFMSDSRDEKSGVKLAAILLGELGESIFRGAYAPTKSNSVFAMEVFVVLHAVGLYPPLWILNWLNDAFSDYLKSKGEESLDRLLGVKRNKGQTPVIKEAAHISAEIKIMHAIGMLISMLNISIEDAAIMVARKLESQGIKCPTPEVLAERYTKRGWSKAFQLIQSSLPTISDDMKKNIIAQYPEDSIPTKLKAQVRV